MSYGLKVRICVGSTTRQSDSIRKSWRETCELNKGKPGLAEDVRRYGNWMREEAFKRIGHLYPQVEITARIPVISIMTLCFALPGLINTTGVAEPFGEVDTLSRAKGTTVDGVKKSGVIESGSGKVKLMKRGDYPGDWDPKTYHRMPVWEACHHLIRALNQKGETEAGQLLARMPERGEQIRHSLTIFTRCANAKNGRKRRGLINEMLLDSNIIIYAFQPEYRKPNLQQLLAQGKFSASAITRLEVMGFWRNTDQQFEQFALFFDAMRLVSVSDDIVERAIELRRQRSMGWPIGHC